MPTRPPDFRPPRHVRTAAALKDRHLSRKHADRPMLKITKSLPAYGRGLGALGGCARASANQRTTAVFLMRTRRSPSRIINWSDNWSGPKPLDPKPNGTHETPFLLGAISSSISPLTDSARRSRHLVDVATVGEVGHGEEKSDGEKGKFENFPGRVRH